MYGAGSEVFYIPPIGSGEPSAMSMAAGGSSFGPSSSSSRPGSHILPINRSVKVSDQQAPTFDWPEHDETKITMLEEDQDEEEAKPSTKKPPRKITSCRACRIRQVRCQKFPEDGLVHPKCVPCENKELECTPYVPKPRRTNNRSGKRIDLAKELLGEQQSAKKRRRLAILSSASTDAQLGDSQFQGALTSAILEFYFTKGVTRLHFLGETNLISNFEKVSRRMEELDPPSAVLVSVILALGARMSNHPMLVGPDAPAIEELSTTPDLSIWGRKRNSACRALLQKAKKDIDVNAIMSKPSMESIATLILAQGLLEHEFERDGAGEAYAGAYMSHIRHLLSSDQGEKVREVLGRGELGRTAYIKDALTSTTSGRSARFTDNDIDMLAGESPMGVLDIFDTANFPIQQPQQLFFTTYRAIFHHIAKVARVGSYALTGFRAMKAPRLDEDAFRDFIDGLQLTGVALPILESRAVDFVGQPEEKGSHFTTNTNMLVWGYVRALRMARAAQLTVPYRVMASRLSGTPYETDKTTKVPMQVVPLGKLVAQVYHGQDAEFLHRMHTLAMEVTKLAFASARELATQLDLTMRCGMPMSMLAGVHATFARTPLWARPLVNTPSTEEGGPPNFTFEQKIQELGFISTALKFAGWAFDELAKPAVWLDAEIEQVKMKQVLWNRAREGTVPAPPTLPPPFMVPAGMGPAGGGVHVNTSPPMMPLLSSPLLGTQPSFSSSGPGLAFQPVSNNIDPQLATMGLSDDWALPELSNSPTVSSSGSLDGFLELDNNLESAGLFDPTRAPFAPTFSLPAACMGVKSAPMGGNVMTGSGELSAEALQAFLDGLPDEAAPAGDLRGVYDLLRNGG